MAGFTTEILIFETSEAFRNDPDIIRPAMKLALNAGGINAPSFYGTQIENPNTGYAFLHWDNYEAHKAFIGSPSYAATGKELRPSLGGKANGYHVTFSAPTIALEQPVTAMLILSLNAPENRAAVVELLTKVSEANEKLVFGQTREDENKYIVIAGWPSVEVHWEVAAKPEVKAIFDALFSLANKEYLYHMRLSQCQL